MAQLPPRVPNMTPSWLSNHFPHQKTQVQQHQQQHQNSWMDEFLDFSSIKRGAHRRSVSDSIAFLETPLIDEDPCGRPDHNSNNDEFDRLDDEQLMSMFTDDISGALPQAQAGSSSNPSSPSDHNSINDEKPTLFSDHQHQIKNESGEVQSPCIQDPLGPPPTSTGEPSVDIKRVKRILANRQSAQRSRVRKLQYISELERSVTSLQTEVSALSPRVAFLDHQRLVLNVDNSALKQRIAALAQDKIFKDAHQEALRKEIERLRQMYQEQNMKKMECPANNTQGCMDGEHHQIKVGGDHVLC